MSKKNKDDKNRWRTETIAFRLSPEERAELDKLYKLCGYQTKQDFILDCLFKQRIVARETPMMITSFRKELRIIISELERLDSADDIDEELFTPVKRMLEILEAFDANR